MRLYRIAAGSPLAAVLVIVAGCGGGGGTPTSSATGTAAVQGQLLREPTVQVSAAPDGLAGRLAALLAPGTLWAAPAQPVPVPGMRVELWVGGRSMGSTTTDGAGRFRFDGMPAGTAQLHVQTGSARAFDHTTSMERDRTMATYCVLWGSGGAFDVSCRDEAGDHWDDMMRGQPGSGWDMGAHRWGGGGMMR